MTFLLGKYPIRGCSKKVSPCSEEGDLKEKKDD
jgi:hypothetical protein